MMKSYDAVSTEGWNEWEMKGYICRGAAWGETWMALVDASEVPEEAVDAFLDVEAYGYAPPFMCDTMVAGVRYMITALRKVE